MYFSLPHRPAQGYCHGDGRNVGEWIQKVMSSWNPRLELTYSQLYISKFKQISEPCSLSSATQAFCVQGRWHWKFTSTYWVFRGIVTICKFLYHLSCIKLDNSRKHFNWGKVSGCITFFFNDHTNFCVLHSSIRYGPKFLLSVKTSQIMGLKR